MGISARWLDRKACAAYICVKVSALRRLTKQGLLPPPSLLLGPRTPRWDREAVDRLFLGRAREDGVSAAVQRAVAAILAEGEIKQRRRAERQAAEAEKAQRRAAKAGRPGPI
jgi:hypothetical protein